MSGRYLILDCTEFRVLLDIMVIIANDLLLSLCLDAVHKFSVRLVRPSLGSGSTLEMTGNDFLHSHSFPFPFSNNRSIVGA